MICHVSLLVPWIRVSGGRRPRTNLYWSSRSSPIFNRKWDIRAKDVDGLVPNEGPWKKKPKQQNILWKWFCDDVFVKGQGWKVSRQEIARVFYEGARAVWPGVVIALKTQANSSAKIMISVPTSSPLSSLLMAPLGEHCDHDPQLSCMINYSICRVGSYNEEVLIKIANYHWQQSSTAYDEMKIKKQQVSSLTRPSSGGKKTHKHTHKRGCEEPGP